MTTEYVSQFVADSLPFARLLGLELVTVTPERVEAVLESPRRAVYASGCPARGRVNGAR